MAEMPAGDAVTALQDALMAIDGVTGAHVEVIDGRPPSVRLQVESGTDRRAVGELVQQVLTRHGLSSRIADVPPVREAPSAPDAPDTTTAVSPPASMSPVRHLATLSVQEGRSRVVVTARDDRDGVVEVASGTGRRALRDAIVSATARLVDESAPSPSVVAIRRGTEGGRDVLTVVLDRGAGRLTVGSAFVAVGWEFAFARAVWAALVD